MSGQLKGGVSDIRPEENPANVRRNAWTVTRNGSPICRMVGQPMTAPKPSPQHAGAGPTLTFWSYDMTASDEVEKLKRQCIDLHRMAQEEKTRATIAELKANGFSAEQVVERLRQLPPVVFLHALL